MRGSGNVIGGAVLLRLAPGAVTALARGHRIAVVTGTNGKSTTTAMIVAALRSRMPVATNDDGANTPHGIAWAVVTAAAEDVVLEVDEAWLPWAVRVLQPDTVVLLNLTRDQLHRKPEIRPVAETWRAALGGVPRVVAAADDPAVVWACADAVSVDYVRTSAEWTADAVLCPACGDPLATGAGPWGCPCGFYQPRAAVEVVGDRIVTEDAVLAGYDTLPGSANVANAAVAVAAVADRVAPDVALAAISAGVRDIAGRYLELSRRGCSVRLLLAKNPAGWQAVLGMLRDDASVLLAFSADGVDGRDTSWLYDVSFDRLRGRSVAVTGTRGTDLAVRLHLDGIDPGAVLPSAAEGLDALPPRDIDVVATYSAFQAVRKELGLA